METERFLVWVEVKMEENSYETAISSCILMRQVCFIGKEGYTYLRGFFDVLLSFTISLKLSFRGTWGFTIITFNGNLFVFIGCIFKMCVRANFTLDFLCMEC